LRVLGSLLVVLLVLAGVVVAASAWTASQFSRDVDRISDVFPEGDRPSSVGGSLTFLLVGLNTSPGSPAAGEPDMIGLGRIPQDRSNLQMVSMPANLWLDPDDEAAGTLRQAFDAGGPKALVAAVERVSGVRVDHYADLDFDAFRHLTDALGGITVDVPDLHQSRGEIFEPGVHTFDGEQALEYMSSPRVETDQASAVPRQQQVVQGLFAQVRRQGLTSNLGRLTGLVGLLTDSLRVDDTVDNALLTRLAWDLHESRRPDLVTVPVTDVTARGGIPVHDLDATRAGKLFEYLRLDTLRVHLDEF
jgi:LCP family protein required for cell wall assembly